MWKSKQSPQSYFKHTVVFGIACPVAELKVSNRILGTEYHLACSQLACIFGFLRKALPCEEVVLYESVELVVKRLFDGPTEVVVVQPSMPAVHIIGLLAYFKAQVNNRVVLLVVVVPSVVLLYDPCRTVSSKLRHRPEAVP